MVVFFFGSGIWTTSSLVDHGNINLVKPMLELTLEFVAPPNFLRLTKQLTQCSDAQLRVYPALVVIRPGRGVAPLSCPFPLPGERPFGP